MGFGQPNAAQAAHITFGCRTPRSTAAKIRRPKCPASTNARSPRGASPGHSATDSAHWGGLPPCMREQPENSIHHKLCQLPPVPFEGAGAVGKGQRVARGSGAAADRSRCRIWVNCRRSRPSGATSGFPDSSHFGLRIQTFADLRPVHSRKRSRPQGNGTAVRRHEQSFFRWAGSDISDEAKFVSAVAPGAAERACNRVIFSIAARLQMDFRLGVLRRRRLQQSIQRFSVSDTLAVPNERSITKHLQSDDVVVSRGRAR